jgi:hypothetical protein
MGFYSYFSGFVVLGVLWVLYKWLGGTWNPCKLIEGADGRSSASKLQWFFWTVVVIFFYVAIYTARAVKGHYEPITEIPANLLIAMGFSVTTMAASKGIMVAYVSSGRVTKTKADPNSAGPGSIFQDDTGFPDLSKIQMLAWVLIAIGIYIINAIHQIGTVLPQLPDIDPALMVLMGLGQGAYLGKKLTSTAAPRLTGLSQGSGKPGTMVTVTGLSFGEKQNGSLIAIDGNPFSPSPAPEWRDTQIKFTIPAKQPDGRDWLAGHRISIGVIVGGQESTNTLPFTVTAQ